ncbi:hypothetical protein C7399_109176 [Paraburkholderia tropica]|uniref:Uncharacterized protein n=1 Tax=Paraburkholderia tropica TaxID=92647 RepID=A0ABX5MRM9_9BURK|nr:hypothetical protein [Paraburkholderia tropica]PXX15841.1 hypothetical protein C7400_109176 [Paraburkholderia tropica]PZW82100.1 hypothetical protein C7399_109176 [Paraburkholderia tropica]
MPWAAVGAAVGTIGGAAVSSAMSPSTSGSSSYYVPTGLGTADTTWQGLLSNLNNVYNNTDLTQYALSSLYGGLNADAMYSPGYLAAAQAAGQGYTNAGSALTTLGNQDLATQQQLLSAGQNVYNMGLDPQNALYNRTAQQLQDQTGATNSMYGLGSSAAGAGVANQAMSNFNIDWQNNQLSRAAQGLSAYTSAANTAGQYGTAGANALTSAPQYTLAGGSTPYNVAQSVYTLPGQLANTYGSFLNQNVYGPAEGLMGSIIPYMNNGQGAQSVPFQNASTNAQSYGQSLSSALGGIGNSVQNAGGLSNLFSGTTGSYGSGDFSGAFTSSPYYSGGGNSYGFTM